MTISAKVIAHSKSSLSNKEVITFELEFPRIILAEFNTHNALSKNSSSSRAIPVAKMLEQVRNNPAMPARFGKKNKGMQDAGEHNEQVFIGHIGGYYEGYYDVQDAWSVAAEVAAGFAYAFDQAGYAKQICNRLIEPFQMMKVVMTATELNNFFWLRDHSAADPTIEVLAKVIKEAKENSTPVTLKPGDWHTPYYGAGFWSRANLDTVGWYDIHGVSLENALAVSASCCAQVSFRSLDDSVEKACSIVEKLNLKGESNEPVHASPTEHQCTPMPNLFNKADQHEPVMSVHGYWMWPQGCTHVDNIGNYWSGNFQGFIQYRQLITNNVKRG